MLSLIVARDVNGVIGNDNKLLCHIPEDLKRFKNITSGHTIIMGRKTFESLPGILPNRRHIVLSSMRDYNINGVLVVNELEQLLNSIDKNEESFVIGGGAVYQLLLPYVDTMHITEIKHEFKGDTYFNFDTSEWKEVSREKGNDSNYEVEYVKCKRINKKKN